MNICCLQPNYSCLDHLFVRNWEPIVDSSVLNKLTYLNDCLSNVVIVNNVFLEAGDLDDICTCNWESFWHLIVPYEGFTSFAVDLSFVLLSIELKGYKGFHISNEFSINWEFPFKDRNSQITFAMINFSFYNGLFDLMMYHWFVLDLMVYNYFFLNLMMNNWFVLNLIMYY